MLSAEKLLGSTREKLRLWGMTEAQIAEVERNNEPSDHMTIYAPMAGIVIQKNLQEGAYVDTGTRIYTIADLNEVWVKLDAYESDLPWLRYGQQVEFATEAYPGEVFTGTIAFIDPVLNPQTRTVKVRVNVPNPSGKLKPDMFVRADGACPGGHRRTGDGPDPGRQVDLPDAPGRDQGHGRRLPHLRDAAGADRVAGLRLGGRRGE